MPRKILAGVVAVLLALLLAPVIMRTITLLGGDVSWIRGSVWLFIWILIVILGVSLIALLRHKPKQKPGQQGPNNRY